MKIGVITFWHGNSNYGQILQCWALQYYLKKIGHESFIIRFIPQNYDKLYKRVLKKCIPVEYLKRIISRFCFASEYKLYSEIKKNDAIRAFDSFREKNLKMSFKVYDTIDEIKKYPPDADCYIVGSDQVWGRLLSNPNNRAYFLDFGRPNIKRISYAPSFVVDCYPDSLKSALKENLKRFSYISTREYNGIEICRDVGYEAEKVVDPTLLLKKQDYVNLFEIKTERLPQIFIYSLNIKSSDEIRWNELSQIAANRRLSVLVTPAQGYFHGEELFGKDVKYLYATPNEWLSSIYHSSLVVTTSFHGVALSIILESPFVYIPLKGKYDSGNNRIYDLLSDLNLTDRILSDTNSYNEIIQSKINWDNVHKELDKQRKSSVCFLNRALNTD